MKTIVCKELEEIVYYDKLSNGLEIFILPQKELNRTFATFSVNFGSTDIAFIPRGQDSPIHFPPGIAHFLEHTMFYDENTDVFKAFAKHGATANAFTNFTQTGYTFSATSNIPKNLTTLLDFVQNPFFTDAIVANEKRIIEQEIKMYDDHPDWRFRFSILENMYKNHPVKFDIAGTISSISRITKEDLYACYKAFYHPSNMVLFVIGSVSPREILKVIKDNQELKSFQEPDILQRISTVEDPSVNKTFSILKSSNNITKFFIGHKELFPPCRKEGDLLKYELSLKILLELMFGDSSEAYEEMYDKGYLDESFTYEYTNQQSFGFSIIGGNSRFPEEVVNIINDTIHNFKNNPLRKYDVARIIKQAIGHFLKSINSPQFIANQFTRYHHNGINFFDILQTLENLSEIDLEEALHSHFSETSKTTLIVKGE